MQFPVTLTKTFHKHGGRIVRIDGVYHETAKPKEGRSQDIWFFRGLVEWDDGSGNGQVLEIAPYQICYHGEDRTEVDALMEALNEYLHENGEWFHQHKKHEGWYANVR